MDIAEAPQWLIELCGRPREKSTLETQIELDTDAATKRAIAYLKDNAPETTEGSRNYEAFKVAARVKDFGVSEALCLDLVAEHWNDVKVSPPLPASELEHVVGSAYRYGTAAIGKFDASLEFEPYNFPVSDIRESSISSDAWPSPAPMRWQDPVEIPRRHWIVDGMLAKGYVSALVAPSGAGKTQYLAQLLLAIATGRGDIAHCTVRERCNVWCWNQEDEIDELDRRMAAARVHFGIDREHATSHVYLNSGSEKPLILAARDTSGLLRRTKHVTRIIDHIKVNNIGVLVIDPLAEFHEADNENDNVQGRAVAATLRHIAASAGCAIMFGHHTKKPDNARSDGFAGNADSSRGASAVVAVTRVVNTLYAMSPKDADHAGIPAEDRGLYVRLDTAKSNLSIAAGGTKPLWFKRTSVQLGFEGEHVGALVPTDLAKVAAAPRVLKEEPSPDETLAALANAMGDRSAVRWPDINTAAAEALGVSEKTLRRRVDDIGLGLKRLADGRELRFEGGKGRGSASFVIKLTTPEWMQ